MTLDKSLQFEETAFQANPQRVNKALKKYAKQKREIDYMSTTAILWHLTMKHKVFLLICTNLASLGYIIVKM